MAGTALQIISATANLQAAWLKLFERSTARSRRSSGVDDETLIDFDASPLARCRLLSQQLRNKSGYQFSALQAHLVPKKDGRDRVICVPTVRDRVVQRAIVDFLSKGDRCGLANAVSFGFIPGRSVEKAVERARALRREFPWAYKTDISSFFDSIPRSVLHERIRRYVHGRSLHRLLIAASESEIQATSGSREKRIKQAGIMKGRGIRQGMPLSPFFANLILKEFDRSIQAAAIPMVRYADDLICFSKTQFDVPAIHSTVEAALKKEGLEIPQPGPSSKTQLFAPNDAAEFLGLHLRQQNGDYLLEVSKEQTLKIRQRIIEFADFSTLQRAKIDLGGFFRRIDGMIAGYSGAYAFAHNAAHFERALDGAREDAVERLFSVGLGIPIGSISTEGKKFLGIAS